MMLHDDPTSSGMLGNEPDLHTPAKGQPATRLPYPRTMAQYVLMGVLIIAICLGIGGSVYVFTPVPYRASCLFRVALPLTAQTGSDYFAASQDLARTEVAITSQSGAYADALARPGVDRGGVLGARVVTPTGVLDYTSVTVSTHHSDTASTSANALCTAFVNRISAVRKEMRGQEASDLAKRIVDFGHRAEELKGGRSTSVTDQSEFDGLVAATVQLKQTLTQLLAMPPDVVVVTATASAGFRLDQRNLAADLFVAGACGLLATFLIVLASDALLGRELLVRAREP